MAVTVRHSLALAAGLAAALGGPVEAGGYRIQVAPDRAPPVVLYAEETGHGSPVLLIHGLGESTFTWRKIVPALAERHRVVALDLKGFGRSEKPLDETYSADDQAELVAAFIMKRGLRDVALVGHSFGGTVALRTALLAHMRREGRISRLVVIGAPALPRSAAPYLDLVEVPAVTDALMASLPPELLARVVLREALGGARDIPEEDVKGYAAPYYELAAKHAFLVTARSIVSERNPDIARRYRTIKAPALLVWCRDDPIVPLGSGRRLARTLPAARLAVLKGCHHLPQDERPQALLALIGDFIGR
jgi:pimeloyl-ACP methyl ester carboxylesterase